MAGGQSDETESRTVQDITVIATLWELLLNL
jgi:hypothetical protein